MSTFSYDEIIETNRMIKDQGLDVRTITMGISLIDCVCDDFDQLKLNIYDKIYTHTKKMSETASEINEEFGIPIINKRITITPISLILGGLKDFKKIEYKKLHNINNSIISSRDLLELGKSEYSIDESYINICLELAHTLDKVCKKVKCDFLGGYSALVQKGFTISDLIVINSLPQVLSKTERVCASINLATSKTGINMNAVRLMGEIISDISQRTKDENSIGCAKLVCFSNAVEDNPFMAGGFHGIGESEASINVGISGPGVVRSVVSHHKDADFETLAEAIKKTAFKITRLGQLVAIKASEMMEIPFGIVDLSLAPTTRAFDSVAGIIEEMGLETMGGPGSTAALSVLTDAIKKGGLMASHYVGGLSGAFIPVAEDRNMNQAAQKGILTLEKLEALTTVCSTGLDMICIPGDTTPSTISGIIADAMTIGMINGKTIGTRLIPVAGKNVGESVKYGGLLGEAVIMPVKESSCEKFIKRLGRIPAPIHSFRN